MSEGQSHNPGVCYEMGDLISRIRRDLVTDPPALGVFEHIRADSDREDAQIALGTNATQINFASSKIARSAFLLLPERLQCYPV
jgi:hypothetical protein